MEKKLPDIEEISVLMPAVSEYCNVTRLPELFKEAESDTLPVIDLQGRLIGIVSEHDLASVIPAWSFRESGYRCDITVADIMTKNVWTEQRDADIKELTEKINTAHTRVIPIIDKHGIYTGNSVTRSSVISYFTKLIKPESLGGLATPLGVYITDGKHQAGAGNFALFLTGVSIGSIIVFVEHFFRFIYKYFSINPFEPSVYPFIFAAQIFLFILILKLTPLSQIHAAEHQTINAIEKGLPLTLEAIKTQPREHKRCGTNLMVLFIGLQFVIILFAAYIKRFDPFLQFIFLFWGFIYVFSHWKDWGMWLQKHFTTVNAPNKYILSGIKAGEEILRKHKKDLDPKSPSLMKKIWCMGLIQIIAGFILVQNFFDYIFSFIK